MVIKELKPVRPSPITAGVERDWRLCPVVARDKQTRASCFRESRRTRESGQLERSEIGPGLTGLVV